MSPPLNPAEPLAVEAHLLLIRPIARRRATHRLPREDAAQAGAFGLMRAVPAPKLASQEVRAALACGPLPDGLDFACQDPGRERVEARDAVGGPA